MSIADKLKTVAQKIPDVYRTGLFKYAPKSTASGETILLENSAPEPFVSMTVHGKSWHNGIPTPSAPIEIESAKEVKVLGGNLLDIPNKAKLDGDFYRIEEDGSISFQVTEYGDFRGKDTIPATQILKAGDYTLALPQDERTNDVCVEIYGKTTDFYTYAPMGSEVYVHLENDTEICFKMYTNSGTIATNLHLMLNEGNVALPFEPYKEPQTLTLPTLHGIGDVRDYVDYERKKLVRKIGVLSNPTFQLSSGYFVDDSELFSTDATNSFNDYSPNDLSVILSNKLSFYKEGLASKNETGAYQGYRRIYARIQGVTSEEEFNSLMQGSEFLYILAEPIETDLTDEQIYAFKRLRANSPNTTIIGQGQVDVTYIVDNRQ